MSLAIDHSAAYVDAKKELYRRDFRRFAAEQLTITGVEPGQMLHFAPFLDGQELLHAVVERQLREQGWVRVVFIKSRQLGGSTYTAGRAFWLAASKCWSINLRNRPRRRNRSFRLREVQALLRPNERCLPSDGPPRQQG